MTDTWMATATRLIPVTVDTFDTPQRYESSQTMTDTWMATATRLILVTVDTFDTPQRYESSKTMTVTRMGDRDPPDPCDC